MIAVALAALVMSSSLQISRGDDSAVLATITPDTVFVRQCGGGMMMVGAVTRHEPRQFYVYSRDFRFAPGISEEAKNVLVRILMATASKDVGATGTCIPEEKKP